MSLYRIEAPYTYDNDGAREFIVERTGKPIAEVQSYLSCRDELLVALGMLEPDRASVSELQRKYSKEKLAALDAPATEFGTEIPLISTHTGIPPLSVAALSLADVEYVASIGALKKKHVEEYRAWGAAWIKRELLGEAAQ